MQQQARESLKRRPDVREDDIDDIVGIASELQADREGRIGVAEVERVAAELDLSPELVEQAIAELGRRREAAAEEARRAEEGRAARSAARSALLRRAGLVGAVVAGIVGLLGGGVALSAGAAIRAAEAEVARTEQALDTVLDRQERLVPQLVAISGGRAELPDVPDEGPMEVRLAASDRLARELAAALGELPPGGDPQLRLNLQHELAGAENRIAVERMRWEAARAERDRVAGGPAGGLARALGF